MPELHCVDTKTYVERGIEWDLDTDRLQTTKNMLLANRTTLPAFDTQRYTVACLARIIRKVWLQFNRIDILRSFDTPLHDRRMS